MKDHIFKVLIDIEPHPKHRIEPDLEEKELAAIGYVVTQWSYLEHSILASTIELCSAKKTNPPMDAASPPSNRRPRQGNPPKRKRPQ
jgi:hypothetical protein